MTAERPKAATRRAQAAATDAAIPDKLYFRIGEVSELVQAKPYVLRYWETEFPMLKPQKSRSGQRTYRRRDVEMILEIKRLLYDKGFTIEGARQQLARPEKESAEQKHLFHASVPGPELKAIKRELQSILTMLSRRC
jgi:DNA-binding transcriptional MerR regulator